MTFRLQQPPFLLFVILSSSLHVGLMFLFPQAKTTFSNVLPQMEVQIYEHIANTARTGSLLPIPVMKPKVERVKEGELPATPDSPTVQTVTSSEVGSSTRQAFVDEYTRDLLLMIQKRNVYPRMAQKMGHTGRVLIRLKIARNGNILESKILETSPYQTLNEAAEKLMGSLPKLRPFPENMTEEEWIFNIPIDYKI